MPTRDDWFIGDDGTLLDSLVVIERKNPEDLVACVTSQRERFERELTRLDATCRWPFLVVEADLGMIERGEYRSQLHPNGAFGSVSAWLLDYPRLRTVFAPARSSAQRIAYRLLAAAWRRVQRGEVAA